MEYRDDISFHLWYRTLHLYGRVAVRYVCHLPCIKWTLHFLK